MREHQSIAYRLAQENLQAAIAACLANGGKLPGYGEPLPHPYTFPDGSQLTIEIIGPRVVFTIDEGELERAAEGPPDEGPDELPPVGPAAP